jgi:predicted amidohydrolase
MVRAIPLALLILFPAAVSPQQKPAKTKLRVAGAQLPVVRDVAANVAALKRAIDYAIAEKADILVTPEGSLSGYVTDFDAETTARALDEVVRKAKEGGVALALGTCFREPEDGRDYDELRFYDKTGAFLGYHAKILLCKRVAKPDSVGEIDHFKTKPLRTFALGDLTVGGLVCNDLWANPEWTPMDDPHLVQQLSRKGARVVFHSVNSGLAEGEELALNRAYHESNLRIRARGGRVWIVVADAADPEGRRAGNAPSGIVGPDGMWLLKVEPKGERFFAATVEIEN